MARFRVKKGRRKAASGAALSASIKTQGRAFTSAFAQYLRATSTRSLDLQLILRKLVVTFFEAVVDSTPVDTGRARASWRLEGGNLDLRFSLAREGVVRYEKEASGGGRRVVVALPQVKEEFSEGPLAKGRKGYRVRNEVPYVLFLELGSSDQAPQGIVRINLAILARNMRQAARAAEKRLGGKRK